MAITYPLDLPAEARIATMGFAPRAVVALNISSFDLSQEVLAWPGQAWNIKVTLADRRGRALGAPVTAFLLALNGREGTFLLGDPMAPAPRGTALGTPLVDGAQLAGARVLNTKGWTPSQTGVLKAMDYLQLGSGATSRLHVNLRDVNADGDGKASLDLWPALRPEGAADNAVITTSNCRGVFRLGSNAMAWGIGRRNVYSISFDADEAL